METPVDENYVTKTKKQKKVTKEKSSCPICKKKFSNVLLHVDKKTICKDKMNEEDYNWLKEISAETRREKIRIAMAKRREKPEAKDSNEMTRDKLKICGEVKKECNNIYKEKSRKKARESDLEKVKENQRRWKSLSRKKAMVKEGKVVYKKKEIPDRCPSCKVKKKNILLHIQASKSCYQEIDKQKLEEWSEYSIKWSKSLFQYKYVDRGDHTKAMNKYLEKKRNIKRDMETKRILKRDCSIAQRERKIDFVHMIIGSLLALTQGRTPRERIRKFHLVLEEEITHEDEVIMTREESNAWLKEYGTDFVRAAMTIQMLVHIPKSKWLNAIESLDQNQGKEELRNKVFRLIGKLQAGENERTKGMTIDEKYQSEKKISSQEWSHRNAANNHLITNEDEKILIEFVTDIIGDNEVTLSRDMQELLGITKENDDLYNAFTYTTNKTY